MDTQTIQKQINLFVEKTTKSMDVEKIILYGSALQNNDTPHDIDLIVMGNFPDEDTEGFLYDMYTDIPRTIDFHVYGVASHDKMVSSFLKQALSEGKIIYSSSS